MVPNGDFVAAWQSFNPQGAGETDDRQFIFARLFDYEAVTVGFQFPDAVAGNAAVAAEAELDPNGGLPIDFDCPQQQQATCKYTVTGETLADRFTAGRGARAIGRRPFSLAAGRSLTARFRLPATARRQARRRGRLRVRLTIASVAGPSSRTLTRTVTLRPHQTRVIASESGRVAFRVHHPLAQRPRRVTVMLLAGKAVVARRRVRLGGGASRVVRLRCDAIRRRALRAGRSLRLTLVVTAVRDEPLTLAQPSLGADPPNELLRRRVSIDP